MSKRERVAVRASKKVGVSESLGLREGKVIKFWADVVMLKFWPTRVSLHFT